MNKLTTQEINRLRQAEEKYRQMVAMAHDAIFAIDPDNGMILEVNPKAMEMTGLSEADLLSKKAWELHPEDEQELAQELFDQVVTTGQGIFEQLHFVKPDNSRVAIDVSASVIRFGDSRLIQRICRDVTPQRQLQKQNAYLKEYFERILDLLPVGLCVRRDIDSKPELEFVNRKLKETFGFDNDESAPCFTEQCQESGVIFRSTAVNDDGVYAEERQLPDGRIFQFTITYIRGINNKWYEIQIVREVTTRRKLEDDLRLANEDLEGKVLSRTAQLREKQVQLAQSEKMASLGNLVAGIAHEINTPLGALSSNNDVFIRAHQKIKKLIAGSNRTEQEEKLDKLFSNVEKLNDVSKGAVERIVNIVTSLRNFARLDQADMDYFDLHEGLESTLTLVRHELKYGIELKREFGDLPKIFCHPNRINQVFMNLFVNAAQAMDGKGLLDIRTYTDQTMAIVEIRDSGQGIKPENLAQIFDPGFTTKGVGVGTGLGLSIVHQIITDHGGRIEVESEPGVGSLFRISLPLNHERPHGGTRA